MSNGGNTANVAYVAFRYMYPGTNEYLFEILSESKPESFLHESNKHNTVNR